MMTHMTKKPHDVVHNLAMAVIDSSVMPILLLDETFHVITASASSTGLFGQTPSAMRGQNFFELGGGGWNKPQLHALLRITLAGGADLDAYEMDMPVGDVTHKLLLHAQKLDYDPVGKNCLLLTISDVTLARMGEQQRDDLLREKAVLLKELQHRIANSLQIIASVLMQSARRVQSEEARSHLRDARNRVMSVATLQQQLSEAGPEEVRLDDYFTRLCQSLSASMVHDASKIKIAAIVDDSRVSADQSVSLGLIVTELVINSLKHALPGDREGNIFVRYNSTGAGWQLSVSDTGVGTRESLADAKPGLGTSIVEALASQLDATLSVESENPGVIIKVTHAVANAADQPTTGSV